MKKALLILSLAVVAFGSCKKSSSSSTTTTTTKLPTYTIDGIHDVYITANSSYNSTITLPITVQFQDSFQKQVSLTLAGLPTGVVIDSMWSKTGYPTFNTSITFYDTSFLSPAALGTYPMTITASGPAGTQNFTFNLKVVPPASCTDNLVGRYSRCSSSCSGFSFYDTVSADPGTPNKIWFKNIGNTHTNVYAMYSCITGAISIPTQSAGGYIFQGNGSGASSGLSMTVIYGKDTCDVSMSK